MLLCWVAYIVGWCSFSSQQLEILAQPEVDKHISFFNDKTSHDITFATHTSLGFACSVEGQNTHIFSKWWFFMVIYHTRKSNVAWKKQKELNPTYTEDLHLNVNYYNLYTSPASPMDRKKFRNWVDFLTCQLHPFTPFSMFGKNQTRSWRIVYQNTGWLSCMVANLSLSNSASNLVFVSYIVHICVWFQLKKNGLTQLNNIIQLLGTEWTGKNLGTTFSQETTLITSQGRFFSWSTHPHGEDAETVYHSVFPQQANSHGNKALPKEHGPWWLMNVHNNLNKALFLGAWGGIVGSP